MPKTSIALAITVAACFGMWAYVLRVANPNKITRNLVAPHVAANQL